MYIIVKIRLVPEHTKTEKMKHFQERAPLHGTRTKNGENFSDEMSLVKRRHSEDDQGEMKNTLLIKKDVY